MTKQTFTELDQEIHWTSNKNNKQQQQIGEERERLWFSEFTLCYLKFPVFNKNKRDAKKKESEPTHTKKETVSKEAQMLELIEKNT